MPSKNSVSHLPKIGTANFIHIPAFAGMQRDYSDPLDPVNVKKYLGVDDQFPDTVMPTIRGLLL